MNAKNPGENVLTGLEKFGNVYRLLSWNVATHDPVSPMQMQILEHIDRNPESFNTVSHIALEFDLKKPTVSDSVKNLTEKGFVRKQRDDHDGRIHYLVLTEKGRDAVRVIREKNGILTDLIGEFSNDHIESVNLFLMELLKKMHMKGLVKYARMCMTCGNFKNNRNGESGFYCSYLEMPLNAGDLKYTCPAYLW